MHFIYIDIYRYRYMQIYIYIYKKLRTLAHFLDFPYYWLNCGFPNWCTSIRGTPNQQVATQCFSGCNCAFRIRGTPVQMLWVPNFRLPFYEICVQNQSGNKNLRSQQRIPTLAVQVRLLLGQSTYLLFNSDIVNAVLKADGVRGYGVGTKSYLQPAEIESFNLGRWICKLFREASRQLDFIRCRHVFKRVCCLFCLSKF